MRDWVVAWSGILDKFVINDLAIKGADVIMCTKPALFLNHRRPPFNFIKVAQSNRF